MNDSFSRFQVILHVEDSDIDHDALQRSFRRAQINTPISWCRDAREAHKYLAEHGQRAPGEEEAVLPAVILLDLNLPGEDGRTFLKKIRETPRLSSIPVIILSSSSDPKDVDGCYALGANAYLVKPLNPRDLDPLVLAFAQFWLKHSVLPSAHSKRLSV